MNADTERILLKAAFGSLDLRDVICAVRAARKMASLLHARGRAKKKLKIPPSGFTGDPHRWGVSYDSEELLTLASEFTRGEDVLKRLLKEILDADL